MRTRILTALTALCAVGSLVHPAQSQSRERGLWLWSTTEILDDVNSARANLFAFTANPPGRSELSGVRDNKVTTLYFYAHSYVNGDATKKSKLRSFLRDAHSNGLKVHFLDGAPEWATTSAQSARTYLTHTLTFNSDGADATERFDGIQYDIEPYLLTGWFSQSIWDSFMTVVKDCQTLVRQSGQPVSFGVAIPRWYDSNPGTRYLDELQQAVDYVAVMNYVDVTSRLVADVATEIANAEKYGKKVIVGVETLVISPSSSTFAEEGWGNMEARLHGMNEAYKNSSGFAGDAIHDYKRYAALAKYGTGGVDATAPTLVSTTGADGVVRATVRDLCGDGINASLTVLTLFNSQGVAVSGTWAASSGTFTFTPLAALSGGEYSVKAVMVDQRGNSATETRSVSVTAPTVIVLVVPTLALPVNASAAVGTKPYLTWGAVNGATKYHLQVSLQSDFKRLAVDNAGLTATTVGVSGLQSNKKYYWRVAAMNGTTKTQFSAPWSFTTAPVTVVSSSSSIIVPTSTSTRKQ